MTPDRFAPFEVLITDMQETTRDASGSVSKLTCEHWINRLTACLAEARRAEPSATLTVLDNAFGVTALIDDSMRERDRLHRDAYRLMMVVKKYFGDDAVRTADVIGFLDEQLAAREEPPT